MIDNKKEKEYLAVPFEMMRHGVTVDLAPKTFVIEEYLFTDEEYLPFGWTIKQFTKILISLQ